MNNQINWNSKYITDLVDWDDSRVVLYTEDKGLFDFFKTHKKATGARPYTSCKTRVFLAGDVFFPKRYKKSLARKLKNLGIRF